MNRSTDEGIAKTYFRSDRFFVVGDRWFFTTRESGDHGPYASRAEAEEALAVFLKAQTGRSSSVWDTPGAQN